MGRWGGLKVCLFILLWKAPLLFATDLGLGFNLSSEVGTGFLLGSTKEIVYNQNLVKNTILSELDWNMTPLPYWSAGLELRHDKGFFGRAEIKSALPGKVGKIQDSDYENGDGVKTHFSESDNYSENALLVNSSFGWTFKLAPKIDLEPFLGYDFMYFKWTSRDGYYQYGTSSGGVTSPYTTGTVTPLYGTSLYFEQRFFLPVVGCGVRYHWTDFLSTECKISFSPLSSEYDRDYHPLRLTEFQDYLGHGFMVEPQIRWTWTPLTSLHVGLAVDWRWVNGLIGDEVYQTSSSLGAAPGASVKVTDGAGAEYQVWDIQLTVKTDF